MQTEGLDKDILCLLVLKPAVIVGHGLERAAGGGYLKVVVAVDSGYFLDDIRLHGDVLGSSP